MALLEFRGVSRRFRDGARGEVFAVRGASFGVEPGECVLLTGPSGAGKSTLLALACGLLLPTEGEVWFEGEAFSRLREAFRARARRDRMGVLVQALGLLPAMSALENVLLGSVPGGEVGRASIARARELLARFGVDALAGSRVESLSGGERQRVALARALARAPALLLLDEPTAHLDARHADAVAEAVRAHAQSGGAALLATHDPRLTSALPAARVLDVREGRVTTA